MIKNQKGKLGDLKSLEVRKKMQLKTMVERKAKTPQISVIENDSLKIFPKNRTRNKLPKIKCIKKDFPESNFANIFITLSSTSETKIWD